MNKPVLVAIEEPPAGTGMRSATAPAQAPRPPAPPAPTVTELADRAEALIKQGANLAKKGFELSQIETELKSVVPAILGDLVRLRREQAEATLVKLFAPRFKRNAKLRLHTEPFSTVVEARRQLTEFLNEKTGVLERSAKALADWRGLAQDPKSS